MMALTAAAERAVSTTTRRADVPAVRVVLRGDPTADADGPGLVVATELAEGPGPGETAVSRGAATVYVPSSLGGPSHRVVLDVHDRGGSGPPRLLLRRSRRGPPTP